MCDITRVGVRREEKGWDWCVQHGCMKAGVAAGVPIPCLERQRKEVDALVPVGSRCGTRPQQLLRLADEVLHRLRCTGSFMSAVWSSA